MDAQKLIDEARARIAAKRGTGIYRCLSESSPNLSYSWVRDFAQGHFDDVSIRKFAALQEALDRLDA
jgi:hypothetical protein